MSANMVEDGEERVEEVKRTNSQQQSSFAGGPQKVVGQSVTWFDLLKHVLQMCNSNVEPKNGLVWRHPEREMFEPGSPKRLVYIGFSLEVVSWKHIAEGGVNFATEVHAPF